MRTFALVILICWYLNMLKFALPPMLNIKFALSLMQNPNASQWNIGCVWHVHFMLFVSISFALGTQRERNFQWNMGFTVFFIPYFQLTYLHQSYDI